MHFVATLVTFFALIPRRFQYCNVSLEIEKVHPNHRVCFSENFYIWLQNNQVVIAHLHTFPGSHRRPWMKDFDWFTDEVFLDGFESITLRVNFWLASHFFSTWGLNPGPHRLGKHIAHDLHSSLTALKYSWTQTRWCCALMNYFFPVNLMLEKYLLRISDRIESLKHSIGTILRVLDILAQLSMLWCTFVPI